MVNDKQHLENEAELCNRLNENELFPYEITDNALEDWVTTEQFKPHIAVPKRNLQASQTSRMLLRDLLQGDFDLVPLTPKYLDENN